jgi:probable phosphoglycerate mutase
MRLIFIRHGEPDYVKDSLTEKGIREAKLLNERVKQWKNVTKYYVSPLGRARLTAKLALEGTGIEPEELPWIKEFSIKVNNPLNPGTLKNVPWDFYPETWRKDEKLYSKDNWYESPLYDGVEMYKEHENVIEPFKNLLRSYGVTKENGVYHIDHENDDTTLVFFCHLGASFIMLSELMGMSPAFMWHTFFVAPTSLTIINAEERAPGILNFRIQALSDTTHLAKGGEPISQSGYFHEIFQD